MKTFIVFSKTTLNKPLTLKEILNIKYLKYGIKIFYIFDLTGIFYAFSKGLKLLGTLLLLLFFLFTALTSYFSIESLFIIKTSINLFLVLFGGEIEEFFLKRKGFKAYEILFAKNKKEARFKIENKLILKQI